MTCARSAPNWALATSSAEASDASRIPFASTVQLVDVATNRQIWANTYKGKLDDIFDIQEQVAQQIVEALKLKLSFSEKVSLTKRDTVNAQAYDLYLRGQDYLYRMTKRSVDVRHPAFREGYRIRSPLRGGLRGLFERLRSDVSVLLAVTRNIELAPRN